MYLVTGCAGFIGFHFSLLLLKKGKKVIGIDNINNYYDQKLKRDRLKNLKKFKNFLFFKIDIRNNKKLKSVFKKYKISYVINLAAQAGVRYSVTNPEKYIETNINGFFNIINLSQKKNIKHFLYASTSSVYGNNEKYPLREDFSSSHPAQIYAATKKSNEMIAHSYSSIFHLPTTGLRFFTVYGPWGRPDMALFKFTKNILTKKKIDLYNQGHHVRDFTYIDDIVKSIYLSLKKIPKKNKFYDLKKMNPKSSYCPYRILNIGGNQSVKLKKFVEIIERNIGIKSKKRYLPMQLGDIYKTQASTEWVNENLKFIPKIKINEGIKKFLDWYFDYYKIKNKKK